MLHALKARMPFITLLSQNEIPFKTLRKSPRCKTLWDDLYWTKLWVFVAIYSHMVVKGLDCCFKTHYITIFFEWFPFLTCRCSCFQLGFPIPPRDRPTLWAWWWREEGCQQRLTVSGLFVFLKLGLDISELHNSCCFCFLHWHISLVWCQECGKSFAFVFWITKKKIEVDENRVRVRSLCPYYTIIMQNYTHYSTF